MAMYPAFEPRGKMRLQSLAADGQNACSSGNYAEAEKLYLTVIRESEKSSTLEPEQYSARHGLATVYQAQKRYSEAESIYQQQLTKAKNSPQPNSGVHSGYMSLAQLYCDQGKYPEAEEYFKAALAETEKPGLWLPNRGPFAATAMNLVRFYVAREQYAKAELLFKRILEIYEQEEPSRNSSLPHLLTEFAKVYQVQGKYDAAGELYGRAFAISEVNCGPEDPLTVYCLNELGTLYRVAGRFTEAESIFRRALAIVEKNAAFEMARYCKGWKRLIWRRGNLQAIIRNIESSVGAALNHLAECYDDQQRYAEAEPLRRRSLKITEAGWGKVSPPILATALETYATLLRKMGRETEAEAVEVRVRPIREKYPKASYGYRLRAFTTKPGKIRLRWRLSTFINALRHPSPPQAR
jgi:tetratricopeptide (TPR) repeat protein